MDHSHLDERALVRRSLDELEFPKVLEHVAANAISDVGAELIRAIEPVEDSEWLRLEHRRVQELLTVLQRDLDLPLEGLHDIRPLLNKAKVENAFLQPIQLLNVRDMLRTSRLVKHFFAQFQEDFPALHGLTGDLYENRLLEKHIHDAIDDNGEVRDTASRELARIRRDILDTSNKLRARLNRILAKEKEADVLTDDFITQRDGRFVLPMKTEFKRHIPGIIHGVSNTGATVFIEPAATFELNNEISLLYGEETREIQRILTTLTMEIGSESLLAARMVDILITIDVVRAKARHAHQCGGIMPVIVDEPIVQLHGVRHPLLVRSKGARDVVPLTIEFGGEVYGHLISGPNAGGKTVALKSIGLNVAMAISGIFPIGECTTGFRSIFAAIGDNQSIENDVSTFSSQIIRLREILTNCSPLSLVLVDEICSGTDPQEGSALAVGVMEGLFKRQAFYIVTTHQTSLKSYALRRPEISNACMEFDVDKMEPTYRFLSGVPGNSYAFVLADKLGMPPVVMQRSREYLGEKHNELEESIEIIQRYRRDTEDLKREAAATKARAERLETKYEHKFDEFRRKYKDLVRAAETEAADLVKGANKLIENTVREIREQQKPVTEVRKSYEQAKKDILAKGQAAREKVEKPVEVKFEQGDVVVMEGYEKPGVILALDLDSKSAVVEFNSVKFKTDLSKLKPTNKKVDKVKRHELEFRTNAQTRIDVRGMYAEEASLEVENAIAEAMMGNVTELTVVHGKGTGALRQALQRYLKTHPGVETFRQGKLTEGGAGVTIVELK